MALKVNRDIKTSKTLKANYLRIVRVELSLLDPSISIAYYVYLTKEDRQDGREPVDHGTEKVSGEAFDEAFDIEEPLVEQAYEYLKSLPEFKNATKA